MPKHFLNSQSSLDSLENNNKKQKSEHTQLSPKQPKVDLHIIFNELCTLVAEENYSEVNALISKFNNYIHKILYFSAQQGHAEVVKLLLAANAEVDKANNNNNGVTPLHIAARNGHAEVVKLLLAANAEVDKATNDGETPLHIAAQQGHAEVVKLLLTANAEVDKATNYGIIPLYIAAHYDRAEVVKLLLAANAEVNKATNDGETPLHVAARYGRAEVVKLLLAANAEVDKYNNHGVIPLYTAAHNGRAEVVKLLLAANAEVDKYNNHGITPLYIAAYNGYAEVVKLLLAANAEVDKYSKNIALLHAVTGFAKHMLLQQNEKLDEQNKFQIPSNEQYALVAKELLKSWQIQTTIVKAASLQQEPSLLIKLALNEAVKHNSNLVISLIKQYESIEKLMDKIYNSTITNKPNSINNNNNLNTDNKKDTDSQPLDTVRTVIDGAEFIVSYFTTGKKAKLNTENIAKLAQTLQQIHEAAQFEITKRFVNTLAVQQDKDLLAKYLLVINEIKQQISHELTNFEQQLLILEKHIIYMINNESFKESFHSLNQSLENNKHDNTTLEVEKSNGLIKNANTDPDHTFSPLTENTASTSCNQQTITLLKLRGNELLGKGVILNKFIRLTTDKAISQVDQELLKILLYNSENWQVFVKLYKPVKYNIEQIAASKFEQFIKVTTTKQQTFEVKELIEQSAVNCQLQEELNNNKQELSHISSQLKVAEREAAETKAILASVMNLLKQHLPSIAQSNQFVNLLNTPDDSHDLTPVNIPDNTLYKLIGTDAPPE